MLGQLVTNFPNVNLGLTGPGASVPGVLIRYGVNNAVGYNGLNPVQRANFDHDMVQALENDAGLYAAWLVPRLGGASRTFRNP